MNFYSYLIWEWLGYSRKDPAKRLLEKSFKENIDYTINFAAATSAAKNNSKELRGGHNNNYF